MTPLTTLGLLFLTAAGALAQTPPAGSTLKDVYRNDFLIGAALNDAQFSDPNSPDVALITSQFNAITPENVMKWEAIEPQPGRFNFAPADRFVAFGMKHQMFVVGHTLVWHSQTPAWVFEKSPGQPADRATLLKRMRDHILAVVGRYKGRVKGWDVVNEALAEDGTLRDSPWRRILGDDYIVRAFQFAHEADPKAELYYNDYGLENPQKRAGALAIVRKLKAAGVPLTGVGIQDHVNLDWPAPQVLDAAIKDFGRLGVKVMITELDVDVLPGRARVVNADVGRREAVEAALDPFPAGLPDEMQRRLARRYAELFGVYLANRDVVARVTFWGVTDRNSWLNGFPIRGRTNYPLLFGRDGHPKPAYDAVIDAHR
jgi:endo-1,4-beta-xylanase